MNRTIEQSWLSPAGKEKASEIVRQLEGLTISEAQEVLNICETLLERCVIRADELNAE